MSLNAAEIMAIADCQPVKVAVPEWGGHVYVRCMSGAERQSYVTEFVEDEAASRRRAMSRLVCLTMCDVFGVRLFEDDAEDMIGEKNGLALERVFLASQRENGFTAPDPKDSGANGLSGSSSPTAGGAP